MRLVFVRCLIVCLIPVSAFCLKPDEQLQELKTKVQADKIKQYVISAGGIINANNNTNKISSTLGQPDFNVSENNSYRLYSGFWIPRSTSSLVTFESPTINDSIEIGEVLTIRWSMSVTVDTVMIELSRNNGSTWITLFSSFENNGFKDWRVTRPVSNQCIIRLSDVNDARITGSSSTFSILPKRVLRIENPETQPGGDADTDYRLISVPLELDNPDPASVLKDDLNTNPEDPYDPTMWRFFDYQNGGYEEFGNTRPFEPGRSYFLIVRAKGKKIDAGPGRLVADSLVKVPLDPGWNYISNPFKDVAIQVSDLRVNGDFFELKGYDEKAWSDIGVVTELTPWKGYALKVDAQNTDTLKIRLPLTPQQSMAKPRHIDESGWFIQIKAQSGRAMDLANYAGVRSSALDEWDPNDSYEPPPIGAYVQLYFPHRQWSYRPDIYARDFRTENQIGYNWAIEIKSNIEDRISLTFNNLNEVPTELNVWLVDNLLNSTQNLRENNNYYFENLKKEQIHELNLLVGKDEFVEEKLIQAGAIPDKYELFQNFPNPFNPTTNIRYSLPEPQKVTLVVYNIYGQEVARLIDSEHKSRGFHAQSWDGQNKRGVLMSSGFYFYKIKAGDFNQTKRMLFLK